MAEVQLNEQPARYCDMGRHNGQMRVDFTGTIYMDRDEFERYCALGLRVSILDQDKRPSGVSPDGPPDGNSPITGIAWSE